MENATAAKAPHRQPAVFFSHGTPMMALMTAEEDAYVRSLQEFAASLPVKPAAVVVVSAHGISEDPIVDVNASAKPYIVHDFRGFPGALYQVEYPCQGSPQVAAQAAALLSAAGFETSLSTRGGLDHGVWVPIRAAFPKGDVPIVQISMPYPSSPERILKLGRALAPLRDQGVLLVGSGGLVHNLEQVVWHGKHGPAAAWAQDFDRWVRDRLERKDVASLVAFEALAPEARLAHPEPEHFYPLFFMLGASATGDRLSVIHEGIEYSSLSMACFALLAPEAGPLH